jgi:hypothetical protein
MNHQPRCTISQDEPSAKMNHKLSSQLLANYCKHKKGRPKKNGIGNVFPHHAGSVGNHEEKQASHQLLTGTTFHFSFL